jgi:translocation and assembly module TamB
MRLRYLWWSMAGAGAVTALTLLLLLFTAPGLSLVGRMVQSLSGGALKLTDFGGTSPNRLRAARVEIADRDGVWLRIEQVSLDWSVLALLSDRIAVQQVRAAAVTVLRRPVPDAEDSGRSWQIEVAQLALPRILLAEPVIGEAVTLSAEGSLRYRELRDLAAELRIARADNDDQYRFAGRIQNDVAQGLVTLREGPDGILGRLAGWPDLGPVNLTLRADGTQAANRLALDLGAGVLRAEGEGLLRLPQDGADLDLRLSSPAMSLRPGIGWESLAGEVHLHGELRRPRIAAQLRLAGGRFDGVSARNVALDIEGEAGSARLRGTVDGLMLPGDHPAIFAASPWTIEADADLQAATRPLRFRLRHPLARLDGEARTRGGFGAEADLAVPALAPFAALENVQMAGRAQLHVTLRQAGARLTLAANGQLDANGAALPARLLGRDARLTLTAQLEGADIPSSQVSLAGAGVQADINGVLRKGEMDYRLALRLTNLSLLAKELQGGLSLAGTVRGAMGKAVLAAQGSATLATTGFERRRVTIRLRADGLPALAAGSLNIGGTFNDAPLSARATLAGAARRARLEARWKSLAADADLTLAAAPDGRARLSVGTLSDLSSFAGAALQGRLDATAQFRAEGRRSDVELQLSGRDLRLDQIGVAGLSGKGRIADIWNRPELDLALAAEGLEVRGFSGAAQATLQGPLPSLTVTAKTELTDASGAPAQARARSQLDMPARQLHVASLSGEWRGLKFGLQSPATLHYGDKTAIENLALRVGGGILAGSGQLMPQLAFRATARDLALADFHAFVPQWSLQGRISGDADLSGTPAQPQGRITLRGEGLRSGFSNGLPPGALRAVLRLEGAQGAIDLSLLAGERMRLLVSGLAPLTEEAPMRLKASGTADLALLDPILMAEGRRVRGILSFDAAIEGTRAAPRLAGSGRLTDGEIQDYARGLRVDDIDADLSAEGSGLRIARLTARAGSGSISGSGRLDLFTSGLPVDIALTADRARPIVSDLITATVSGDLRLAGTLQRQARLQGALRVLEGEINLPERYPPEVAVLDVRRRDAPPVPLSSPRGTLTLDMTVRTEGPLFVRGRGIDAEMRGDLSLGGSVAQPEVGGGFRLVRGSYNLGGQRLDFTSGTLRFDGAGLRRRLDPTLDFVAQTVSSGVTARLAVTGYASQPRIVLSSTPSLPQDEVVAHLVFRQGVKQLSALQLASLAQAAASLGGVGGGFNPLGAVRRTLGLDRFSIGSVSAAGTGQSQTTVEAGSYVTRNVYVGVRQNLSGGTRTQVQVDLAERLKALATTNMGGSTQGTAREDTGSSIGLSYELEY